MSDELRDILMAATEELITEELPTVPTEYTQSATCNKSDDDSSFKQHYECFEQNSKNLKALVGKIKRLLGEKNYEEVKIILNHLYSEIHGEGSPHHNQTIQRAVLQQAVQSAAHMAHGSSTGEMIGLTAMGALALWNFISAIKQLHEDVPEFFSHVGTTDVGDIQGLVKAVFQVYSITLTALPYIQSTVRYIKYRRQCESQAHQRELQPLNSLDNNVRDKLESKNPLSQEDTKVCFGALHKNGCFHGVLEILELGLIAAHAKANFHRGWGSMSIIPFSLGRGGWGEIVLTYRHSDSISTKVQRHCVKLFAITTGFLCDKLSRPVRAVGVTTSTVVMEIVRWWQEQEQILFDKYIYEAEPLFGSPAGGNNIRRRKNTIYYKRKNRQPKRRVTRKINNRPKTKKNRKKFKK